ncbi:MAG: hypothetical protein RLZZ621_981 [Gemmatimonadota bacterium]
MRLLTVRTSIHFRLTAWNAGVLACLLTVFAVAGWFTLARVVRERTTSAVRESARAVAAAVMAERRAVAARGEVETERGATEAAVLRELRIGDLEIFITDESAQLMAVRQPRQDAEAEARDRNVVVVPDAVRDLMDQVQRERQRGVHADSAVVVRDVLLRNEPARVAVLRIAPAPTDPADEPAMVVTAVHGTAEDIQLLRQVRTTLLFAIPFALLVSVAAGWLLARRSLAPLEAINTRTASITAADLSARLPVVNPHDELGRLAQIINGLLARVDQAFTAQRQFVADASHELRTPLAIIRGEADVTLRRETRTPAEYRESMDVIRAESIRLSRIVDDLFLLARVDAAAADVVREPVSIEELLQDAVRSMRSLAESSGIELMLTLAPIAPHWVFGDATLLRRLLVNLLDNALRHAPAGSTVSIRCIGDRETIRIRIADAGRGVPAELRTRMFERFVHGHAEGTGLGLAIAQAVAQAHGGQVTLLDATPGATFEVMLPCHSSPGDAIA